MYFKAADSVEVRSDIDSSLLTQTEVDSSSRRLSFVSEYSVGGGDGPGADEGRTPRPYPFLVGMILPAGMLPRTLLLWSLGIDRCFGLRLYISCYTLNP